MTTTTTSKALATLITSRYGVAALECDDIVVGWAAAVLAETAGNMEAAKQWKKLNAQRERAGRYTSIPEYASPMYRAYFGKPERAAA